MSIRFTDGMQFDVEGELRVEERSDGWYVVGDGMLMAVGSEQEGQRFIEERKAQRAESEKS